ncbi:hypothetical protein MicloDRAFT_00000630 [Microvirga lotononidis]|uniref:Uncharacterized protein n=1 Tax=Microvirga lotononidis TaxID=864069 RepID=I4Z4D4_9HYPH|nr:hypothetical protein MicloDRAFT_00000630 [Microvirga lotononidis]
MTGTADPNALIWALNTRLIAGATATKHFWLGAKSMASRTDRSPSMSVSALHRQSFPRTFCQLLRSIPAKPFTTGRSG